MKRRRADSLFLNLVNNHQSLSTTSSHSLDLECSEDGEKRSSPQVSAKIMINGTFVRSGLVNLQKKGAHMKNPTITMMNEEKCSKTSIFAHAATTSDASCTDLSGTANSYSQTSAEPSETASSSMVVKNKKRQLKVLRLPKQVNITFSKAAQIKHYQAIRKSKILNQLSLRIQQKAPKQQIDTIISDQKEFLLRVFEEKMKQGIQPQVQRVVIGSHTRSSILNSRLFFERNTRALNTESNPDSDEEIQDQDSINDSQEDFDERTIPNSQPLPLTNYSTTATGSHPTVPPDSVQGSNDDLGPTGTLYTGTGDSSQQQLHQEGVGTQYDLQVFLSQTSNEGQ